MPKHELPKKCPSCKRDLKFNHKIDDTNAALWTVTCPNVQEPFNKIYIQKITTH